MRWFVYVLSLVSLAVSAAIGQDSFEEKVGAQRGKVSSAFNKASEFAKQGETSKAKSELLSVLDHDSSPAAKLVIGDALHKTDRGLSYKLHKEAYEAAPKEREVILEWAMEQHRAGEYANAIPLYQKYLKLQPDDARMSALLADCLIRVGKLTEAVAAWEAAKHPSNHTGIDFTIYEIYGDLSPVTRRGELIKQIRAGKLELIEKLVDLDLHFDQDWWNSEVDKIALGFDLPRIQEWLKADQPRWGAIKCWVDISKEESISPAEVKARLTKSSLILGGGALPTNTLVAARMIGVILDKKLVTKDELFKTFESELLRRAKSNAGDVEALNLLCALCEANQDRVSEYEHYGWERYGDMRFAGGMLASMMEKKQLRADSPELQKAIEQFPESAIINQFALRAVPPNQISTDQLVRGIKAEYRQPSMGLAIRDTYALKAYFGLLKVKLKSGK